ncbi:hypothetical protein KVT40_003778 [Elsinoe batatas]|uniref:Uncharacterized protein n=1 Tax=Elsinoe batatas TaxID=2601811 RepID=A0A8K0L2U0_9PEZI|nr:hypothetical protein KVT40_003778 [Elsinoe batatas]
MRLNDHTCTACRQETSLHEKSHKKIYDTFHAARHKLLNPTPFDLGDTRKPLRAIATLPKPTNEKVPNPIRDRLEKKARLDMKTLTSILHPPHQRRRDKLKAPTDDVERIVDEMMRRLRVGRPDKDSSTLHESEHHLRVVVQEDLFQEAQRLVEADLRFDRYRKSDWYVKDAPKKGHQVAANKGTNSTPVLKNRDINTNSEDPTRGKSVAASPVPVFKFTTPRATPGEAASVIAQKHVGSTFLCNSSVPAGRTASKTYATAAGNSYQTPSPEPAVNYEVQAAEGLDEATTSHVQAIGGLAGPTTSTVLPSEEVLDTSSSDVAEGQSLGAAGDGGTVDGNAAQQPLTKAEKNKAKKARATANKKAAKLNAGNDDTCLNDTFKAAELEELQKAEADKAFSDKLRTFTYSQAVNHFKQYEPGSDQIFTCLGHLTLDMFLGNANWKDHFEKSQLSDGKQAQKFNLAVRALRGHHAWINIPKARLIPSELMKKSPLDLDYSSCNIAAYSTWMAGWTLTARLWSETTPAGSEAEMPDFQKALLPVRHHMIWLKKLPSHVDGAKYVHLVAMVRIQQEIDRFVQGKNKAEKLACERIMWDYVAEHFAPDRYEGIRNAGEKMMNDFADMIGSYRIGQALQKQMGQGITWVGMAECRVEFGRVGIPT